MAKFKVERRLFSDFLATSQCDLIIAGKSIAGRSVAGRNVAGRNIRASNSMSEFILDSRF